MPALALPKGGGAIRGIGEKFSTNTATGTGAFIVPIATAPGRAGFALGLDLRYDSGAGNGLFGIGWNLSTPSITRKTDKGLPRYVDNAESDVFVLSGAEDLVPVGKEARIGKHRTQGYRPRTEGLFARIERWTSDTGDVHWRATTRDNVLNIYGKSRDARIQDGKCVFSWLLEETRDDRGNVARYVYKAEDGAGVDPRRASESNRFETGDDGVRRFLAGAQRYLKRIQYGNLSQLDDREAPVPTRDDAWHFEVVFDYGEHDDAIPTPSEEQVWTVREDPFSSYRPTFEVRTYRRCRRVLVFHRFFETELGPEPYLVRSTDFTYDTGPVVSYLVAVTQAGYRRMPTGSSYERTTLPPLSLGYIKPEVHDERSTLDGASLEGVGGGIETSGAQWVDLDGEGIAGVLTPIAGVFFFKANHGEGRLGAPLLQRSLPAPAELQSGASQFVDLGADGNLDVVQYASSHAGYFERTAEGGWGPFAALPHMPNIDWNDPNLRFIDIDGDGLPDVFLTQDDAFVWYRSRGKEGFGSPALSPRPKEERLGPAVVFADAAETIHLADMTGDGLTDIVRVRNGEVCYWPNLGYGRFGRKTTLDQTQSPIFDRDGEFDPKNVRFGDIDGSGTSDIAYLGRDGVRIYFNQSGNALSAPQLLASAPPIGPLSTASFVDLFGRGTACLVVSNPLSKSHPVTYVEILGWPRNDSEKTIERGKKPHLLESVDNNLGAVTRMAYAPSTKFYLKDKADGRPWLTRLAFPVHVIERIERYDHVSSTKLVTTYAYHHGYFDGHEREFRGFARVEQWDAESVGSERGKGLFPEILHDAAADVEALTLPPVRTVTWFHTGAFLERERLERALAREYYGGASLDVAPAPGARDVFGRDVSEQDARAGEFFLVDTVSHVEADGTLAKLSSAEKRDAARALRGQVLREEIYAEDGTNAANHPYSVTERNHQVRRMAAAVGDRRGIFFVHPLHTVSLSYERGREDPATGAWRNDDPRVHHEIVLDVDVLGNTTLSAAIAYPRRTPDPGKPEQGRLWATLTQRTFANAPTEPDWYRVGVPIETTTSELTGLAAPVNGVFSDAVELKKKLGGAPGGVQQRIVKRERCLYWKDDLTGPLALGKLESHALPHKTYRQAFSSDLSSDITAMGVTDAVLVDEGGYSKQDGSWWAASGHAVFDATRFYLPVEAADAFDNRTVATYDDYSLLVVQVEDALHNKTTVGERDAATNKILTNGNDYRILGPVLLTDPNRNRTAAEFDALGMVTKTAVMGKHGAGEGDTLADPTTRVEYDLHRWAATRATSRPQPAYVHVLSREQHGSANPRWQEIYSYSDGFGREVMTKVQAEPGAVPIFGANGKLLRNTDGSPVTRLEKNRWIGSGRTVFDDKGHPVKKYEPFFSDTFEYESERELVEWGVTPVLRYDPLGRLVRTDQPNGTHARVTFDAWSQETWDEDDTIAGTPWLTKKQTGSRAEKRAAKLSLAHAGTPTLTHLDAMGRPFLITADNGAFGKRDTRVVLDVEGNQRSLTDARGNMILWQEFDMLARPWRVVRADAGPWDAVQKKRAVPVAKDPDGLRALMAVDGRAIRVWDEESHAVRRLYDGLRRPTHVYVSKDGTVKLVEHVVYGEAHAQPEALNLRTRAYLAYDGAGVSTSVRFDFKGNLEETARRLALEYHNSPDWSTLLGGDAAAVEAAAETLLEQEPFTTRASFDALGRVTSQTTPDTSETRPTYNEANLLERLDARIRGAGEWTAYIVSVDYNARGQRERIAYANKTASEYQYEAETFRLVRQRTVRTSDGETLQDLEYTHDPVGNVMQIVDRVSFGRPLHAPAVAPEADVLERQLAGYADSAYTYDALYQLVEASGRHHPGQQPDDRDAALGTFVHPNDAQALTSYVETYAYDAAGNILAMKNKSAGGPGWTRGYAYAPDSNRLLETSAPGDATGTLSAKYEHDDAGNMARMPHLPRMRWDHANRLRSARKQVGAAPVDEVYFSYDLTGERVRKIYEHGRLVEERIYLGGYEVYRKRDNGALVLERLTLHVNDDRRRIALVETKTADASVPALTVTSRERFQVENQLGSSTMELDRGGTPFSYEEYYAFGTTSFRAADASIATGSKRYRYCGKERDEETGFYYYGARYHAAWLARWTSPDPAGIGAGVNGYVYCHNRPISMIDPDGRIAVLVVVGAALVGGGVGGLIGGAISGIHHGYVKQTTKGLGGAIGDGAKFGAVAGGGGLVVATFLPTVAAVAGVGGAGIGLVSAGAKQVVARTSPYPDDELIREANADSFTAVVGAVFSYLGVKSAKNSDVQAKAAENRASLRDAYQGLRTLWKGKSNAKPATPSGTTSMGDGGPSSGGPPPGGGEGGGEGSAALLLNIGGEGELAGYVDVNPLEGNRLLQDQIVAKNPTGKFVNARAESLPFKDGSAAEVVAKKLPSKVLGENAQKIASEIVRVLTPGGKASVHSETKFGDSTLQAFESAGFKCGPQICHYVKQ